MSCEQSSASECVLVSMLAARTAALKRLHEQNGCEGPESKYLPNLVAYCSKEAHSCVEKAAIISLVQLRILEPDADNSLRGEILRKVSLPIPTLVWICTKHFHSTSILEVLSNHLDSHLMRHSKDTTEIYLITVMFKGGWVGYQ